MKRIIACLIIIGLVCEQSGFAQSLPQLPLPAYLRNQPAVADAFRPVHMRGVRISGPDPGVSVVLDSGDRSGELPGAYEAHAAKPMEYFKIGLALPDETFWVNLRPETSRDVIDPLLERTDLGRILLEADVRLKKDMARMTDPGSPEGRRYWDALYAKADAVYKGEDASIPMNVRPWIVPGEIIIGETGSGAYIFKAALNVMMEQDRVGVLGPESAADNDPRVRRLNEYSAELIREHILPKLIREVNVSGRYAPLRQVYYSLILAQWAKKQRLAGGFERLGTVDNRDLTGLESGKKWSAGSYYKEYRDSFEKGEYSKQEMLSDASGHVIRQYVSGGIVFKPSAGMKILAISEDTIENVAGLPGMANIRMAEGFLTGGDEVRAVKRAIMDFVDGPAHGRMHIIEPFVSDGLLLRRNGPEYEIEKFVDVISGFLKQIPVEIKPALRQYTLYQVLMEIAGNHYDAIASYYDPALELSRPARYQGEIMLEFGMHTSAGRDFFRIVISDNGAGPDAADSWQKSAADIRDFGLYLGGFGVGEANTKRFVESIGGTFSANHSGSRAVISVPMEVLELKTENPAVGDGGEFRVSIGEYIPDECIPQKTLRMYDNLLQGKLLRPVTVSLLPEKRPVRVSGLLITQPSVTAQELAKRVDESRQNSSVPIVVWQEGGKQYIADGHHRAVAAFLQGRKEIDAWIIDVPPAAQGKLEFTKASDGSNMLDMLNVLFQSHGGYETVPLGRVAISSIDEKEVCFKVISEELYSYNLLRNGRRSLKDGGVLSLPDTHMIPMVLERQYVISGSPVKSYGIRSCVCLIVRDEPNKRAAFVHMTADTDASAALDTVLLRMGMSGRSGDARLTIAGGFYYRESNLMSSIEAAAFARGIGKDHIRRDITDDSVRNILYDPATDKVYELTDVDRRAARFSDDAALRLSTGSAKAAVSPGYAVADPVGNLVYKPGDFLVDDVSKDGGLASDDPQIWVPEIVQFDRSKQRRLAEVFFSFEEYMEEALHNPVWGYYGAGKVKIGKDVLGEGAHFATFPEQFSPVFGSLVAKRIVEVYNSMLASGDIGRNEKFRVLEFGAGNGVLAFDILSYLSTVPEGGHITYMIGERSADLRRRQNERLRPFIDQGRAEVVAADARDVSSFSRAPFKGMIVSNELPDAFGVHRVRFTDNFRNEGVFEVALSVPTLSAAQLKKLPLNSWELVSLTENSAAYEQEFGLPSGKGLYVSKQTFTDLMATAAQEWTPEQYVQLLSAIDFREIFVDGTLFPEVGKYSERNKQFIVEGVRRNNGMILVPVNTAAARYIESAARILNSPGSAGYVLTIDYGGNAYYELTDGMAKSRLVRCYDQEHSRNDNPYLLPGERDITSDINFTDLATAGAEAGLVTAYYGSQSNLWSAAVDKDIKLLSTGRYDDIATKFLKGKRFNMLLQKSASIRETPQFSFQKSYGSLWGNPSGAALYASDMVFIDSVAFEGQGPGFRIELENAFGGDKHLYFYLRTLAATNMDLTQTMYSTYTDNIGKAIDIIAYLDKKGLIRRGFSPGVGEPSRDGGKVRGPAALDELLDPRWLGPLLPELEKLNGNKPLAVMNGFAGEVEIEDDFWITPVRSNGQAVLKQNSAIDDMSYVYAVAVDSRISYDPGGEILEPGRDGDPDMRYTHVGYTYRVVVARKNALVNEALYDTSSQIDFVGQISEGNGDIAFIWEFSEQSKIWDESTGKFVNRRQIELETIALWNNLQRKGLISRHVFPEFARFASRRWAGLPIVSNISNPVTLKFFNKYFVPGKAMDGSGLSYDNPGYFEGIVPAIGDVVAAEARRNVSDIGGPEAEAFNPWSVDPQSLMFAHRPLLALWARFSMAKAGSSSGLDMSVDNIIEFKSFVRGQIEKTGRADFVKKLARDPKVRVSPANVSVLTKFFFGDPQDHDRQTAVMREVYYHMYGEEFSPNVLYAGKIAEYGGVNVPQVNQYLRALEAVRAVTLAEERKALQVRSADKELLAAWFAEYLANDEDFDGIGRDGGTRSDALFDALWADFVQYRSGAKVSGTAAEPYDPGQAADLLSYMKRKIFGPDGSFRTADMRRYSKGKAFDADLMRKTGQMFFYPSQVQMRLLAWIFDPSRAGKPFSLGDLDRVVRDAGFVSPASAVINLEFLAKTGLITRTKNHPVFFTVTKENRAVYGAVLPVAGWHVSRRAAAPAVTISGIVLEMFVEAAQARSIDPENRAQVLDALDDITRVAVSVRAGRSMRDLVLPSAVQPMKKRIKALSPGQLRELIDQGPDYFSRKAAGNADGGEYDVTPGGIDFRRLAPAKALARTRAAPAVSAVNISDEWPALLAAVDGSTVPVTQLKSYISKCGSAGDPSGALVPVYVYLAAVLRGEEARGMRTSAQVNDLLSVL